MDDLFALEQAFYTGKYSKAAECDISEFDNAKDQARGYELVCRAKIQCGQAQEVIDDEDAPAILRLYAQYTLDKSNLSDIQEQIENSDEEDSLIKYIGAKVLVDQSNYVEALELLSDHQRSLDCASLMVQIHLIRNRVDLATEVVEQAKQWAQDSIVFNLCEAWTYMRQQQDDSVQNAFYVYEELGAGGEQESCLSYTGQAVAQLMMGRLPEGAELLEEAINADPQNQDALYNYTAVAPMAGLEVRGLHENLNLQYPGLVDVAAKADLFDQVAAKYTLAK